MACDLHEDVKYLPLREAQGVKKHRGNDRDRWFTQFQTGGSGEIAFFCKLGAPERPASHKA